MKTAKERMSDFKARKAEKGQKRRDLWANDKDWAIIKRYADRIIGLGEIGETYLYKQASVGNFDEYEKPEEACTVCGRRL